MNNNLNIVLTINKKEKTAYGFDNNFCKCQYYYRNSKELKEKVNEFIDICMKV